MKSSSMAIMIKKNMPLMHSTKLSLSNGCEKLLVKLHINRRRMSSPLCSNQGIERMDESDISSYALSKS